MLQTKYCPNCSTDKLLSEYHNNRTQRDGLATYCKPCCAKVQKSNREKNRPLYSKRAREYYYGKVYGMSVEGLSEMLEGANNQCEICGDTLHIFNGKTSHHAVDHNHTTGEVRGILCPPCNMGIGHLRDSPAIIEKALDYLNERGHYGPKEAGSSPQAA